MANWNTDMAKQK